MFENSIVMVSLSQESADADRFFAIVAKDSNLGIDEDTMTRVPLLCAAAERSDAGGCD